MTPLTSLCVYCGSAFGSNPRHREAARRLGQLMAARHVTLVYGGGRVGLMGTLADAVAADGSCQPLLPPIDHVIEQGFATAASRRLFTVVSEVDEVLDCIAREPLPAVPDAPALI